MDFENDKEMGGKEIEGRKKSVNERGMWKGKGGRQ